MRFSVVPTVALALACSESLAPGDFLVGSWSSAEATLAATRTGASLTVPCISVGFEPIRLDDSLTFRVTGVVTHAAGLVTVRTGDPWPLAGRLVGDQLVLGQEVLSSGDGSAHVCNR